MNRFAIAMVAAAPWVASAGTTIEAPTMSPVAASAEAGSLVTLITGDRVLVRGTGGQASVTVNQAPRPARVGMLQFTRRGDRYVLPTDAAKLVRDGILDEELFSVTGLVRQGYDDAHTERVPVLMNSSGAALMAAPAGATMRRTLPSVGLAALDEKKTEAPEFWSRLLTSSQSTTKAVDGKLQLTGDVQRV